MSIFAFRKLPGLTYDFSAESRLLAISVFVPRSGSGSRCSRKKQGNIQNLGQNNLLNAPLYGNPRTLKLCSDLKLALRAHSLQREG